MPQYFLAVTLFSTLLLIGGGCARFQNSKIETVPAKPYGSDAPVPAEYVNAPEGQSFAPNTMVTRNDLIGGWRVIKGQTTGFESITLDSDGLYYSHLHDRPFDDGTWELAKATLILRSSADGLSNVQFTHVSLEGKKLKMNVGAVVTVWERVQ